MKNFTGKKNILSYSNGRFSCEEKKIPMKAIPIQFLLLSLFMFVNSQIFCKWFFLFFSFFWSVTLYYYYKSIHFHPMKSDYSIKMEENFLQWISFFFAICKNFKIILLQKIFTSTVTIRTNTKFYKILCNTNKTKKIFRRLSKVQYSGSNVAFYKFNAYKLQ